MTEQDDIQLIRYCRDNNKMNFNPVAINQATGDIECLDAHSSQSIVLTNSELYDAGEYVEFPDLWTMESALEKTGQNCFGTLLAFCFEAYQEEIKELCNVAYCIRKFEKTIGYAE